MKVMSSFVSKLVFEIFFFFSNFNEPKYNDDRYIVAIMIQARLDTV